jgi:hypothetical protein
MGCTSGKEIKKRTTSVEDLGGANEAPLTKGSAGQTNASPDKNGQIGKHKDTSSSNAIQIPGANKSFLAPDGIPFIDDDVEECDAEPNSPPAQTHVVPNSSDKNKNVTTVADGNKPGGVKTSSALEGKGAVVVASSGVTLELREDEQPAVIGEILEQEKRGHVEMNQATSGNDDQNAGRSSAEVSNEENASRQHAVAATKIQAGIRGFLGRKKVKAIRANQQNATDEQGNSTTVEYDSPDRQVITDEDYPAGIQICTEDDPKLNTAATKIQASYKGYKTRKQLSLKK